jgi:hypothetical protein
MTLWISFAQKQYTLHFWLSLAEWVLLPLSSAGLFGVISSWRKLRELNKASGIAPLKNDSMTTSGAPGWSWLTLSTAWASWRLRLSEKYQKLRFPNGPLDKGRAAFYTLLMIAITFGLAFAVTRTPKYPIETHHNVYIWSEVKGQREAWWISSDEPEPNRLPLMRWNCCPDFPCSTVIWPGIIASTAKWEERGACKSIRASGLGWTWEKEIPNVTASR